MLCTESRMPLDEAWEPLQATMHMYRQEMGKLESLLTYAWQEIDSLREKLLSQAVEMQVKQETLQQQEQIQQVWEARFQEQESQLALALQCYQTSASPKTLDLNKQVSQYRKEIMRLEAENKTLRKENQALQNSRETQEEKVRKEISSLRHLLDALEQQTLATS